MEHIDLTRAVGKGKADRSLARGNAARGLFAQGKEVKSEGLLPCANGDRKQRGIWLGALRLYRQGKGEVAPWWGDVVSQRGLSGERDRAFEIDRGPVPQGAAVTQPPVSIRKPSAASPHVWRKGIS